MQKFVHHVTKKKKNLKFRRLFFQKINPIFGEILSLYTSLSLKKMITWYTGEASSLNYFFSSSNKYLEVGQVSNLFESLGTPAGPLPESEKCALVWSLNCD